MSGRTSTEMERRQRSGSIRPAWTAKRGWRGRTVAVLAASIALLAGAGLDASAAPLPSEATTDVIAAAAPAVTIASDLPVQQPEPARDPWARAYWHVFIAFGLTWVLVIGYLRIVGRRFDRLEEEVRRLREDR